MSDMTRITDNLVVKSIHRKQGQWRYLHIDREDGCISLQQQHQQSYKTQQVQHVTAS